MTKGAINSGSSLPLFKSLHFSPSQKPSSAWGPSTGDTGTEKHKSQGTE